jgi:hypothetical protein
MSKIPAWLIDDTSVAGRVFVMHTDAPQFIGELRHEEQLEAGQFHIPVEGGFVLVPLRWIDECDPRSLNVDELTGSVSAAWEAHDDVRDSFRQTL